MKKIFLFSLSLILAASAANAACEVAVLFAGGSAKPHMADSLTEKLDNVLQKQNKKNLAFLIHTPLAANADYLYLVTPASIGFKITVGLIGSSERAYTNVYAGRAFRSEEHVTDILAEDFKNSVLPLLRLCKTK